MKLIIDIDENLYKEVQNEVKGEVCVSGLWKSIANGIPYEERPQGKWIPVSERLPEKYGRYLVTEKEFAIDDRNHRGKFKVETEQVEFHDGKWNRAKFFEVIAWQPLPEPYKGDGAE